MDEDRLFELNQLALRQQVYDQLKRSVVAYGFLVPHVGDPDIMGQMEQLGIPTSLPTITAIALLVANGVFVENSATTFLALSPLAPFPEKDRIRERIWEQLGWGGR